MDRRIEAAIEIMRREPGGNLPVREIASKVRLSRWRFIHLFKAETKLTPKQFMVRIRMRRAEHLLQNSFLSIKEIAAEAGLAESHAQGRLSLQFANWILGCALIYGSLFGIGKLIFKEWGTGLLYLLVAIVAGVLISRNLSRGEMAAESLQLEHAEEVV